MKMTILPIGTIVYLKEGSQKLMILIVGLLYFNLEDEDNGFFSGLGSVFN